MLLFYVTLIFIKILDQYSRFRVKFDASYALKIRICQTSRKAKLDRSVKFKTHGSNLAPLKFRL